MQRTRLSVATLSPAYQRTVEVLGARPFSKPVTFGDDVPKKLQEWCQDVDRNGSDLHALLSTVCDEVLGYGFGGILVDYPPTRDEKDQPLYKTKADEDSAGARPYIVQIYPRNILGWRKDRAGLSKLRLLEVESVADGESGTKDIEQVRVLGRALGRSGASRRPPARRPGPFMPGPPRR